jgi:hypothetical protein
MNRTWIAGLSLALLAALPPAFAAPAQAQKSWDISTWTWIRRKPAERGAAPNGQPLRVDAAAVEQALAGVRLVVGAGEEALFSAKECASLGQAMAEALTVAGPDEDLELLSTARRGSGYRADTLTVTATAFAVDGKLNLIVRDGRLDFLFPYHLNPQAPDFKFGSRSAASPTVLRAAGAESPRPDWVALPLPPPAPRTEVPAVRAEVPAVRAEVPAAKPQPAGPSVEERLIGLKRFRDQNLITEEEYTQKKAEILKDY